MKIVEHLISWQDANDPSIVAHRLYYVPMGTPVDIDNSPSVVIDMPTLRYDLATLPINSDGEDYDLYLAFMDARGNESQLSDAKTENLDNTPPLGKPIWN